MVKKQALKTNYMAKKFIYKAPNRTTIRYYFQLLEHFGMQSFFKEHLHKNHIEMKRATHVRQENKGQVRTYE